MRHAQFTSGGARLYITWTMDLQFPVAQAYSGHSGLIHCTDIQWKRRDAVSGAVQR